MYRKRSLWVVAILCILLLLWFVLVRGRHEKVEPEAAKAAAVVDVTQGQIASSITVAGQFQPYQDVDLHAKVSGYIRKISVDIGDRVRKGQVLAVLEVPELADQLQETHAQVRLSQSEIGRAKSEITSAESTHIAVHAAYTRLAQASKERPGLIAEQELDNSRAKDQESEAQVEVAKAAFDAAQQQFGVSTANSNRVQSLSNYTSIIAPFNGVVTMRYADTGSLIQAGTTSDTQSEPVVRVAQSDLLRLRTPIPEADVPYIDAGGPVQIHVGATGRSFTGKIVRFTRALDPKTRTMLVEVDVPNPDLALTTGMYADTTFRLRQRMDALTVPTQAVVQSGGQPYVLVVNSSNHVEQRTVTLGIETANRVELTGGVRLGERVIASGQTGYQNGELVTPHPAFIPTEKEEVAE